MRARLSDPPAHEAVALTPNALPRPPGERERLAAAWRTPRGWRFLTTVNNSNIGKLYLATALLFFVFGGLLALAMRAQLALPDNALVAARTYNQLFTMHGTVMMFLFAVPVVEAVAIYLLPNMLGARDLPFPRLSAYAYWIYAFGGAAFCLTIFFDVAPDAGWFMYPPLSSAEQSPGLGADFWLLGIGFIEISAIAGAIELVVGILLTRAPGMRLSRMPVFAWAMLVASVMVLLAFPAIIAGTALLELERAFDWPIFIAGRGGDPLLWQHLFWFFGHPEVYIIFLPAAGMVSMILPVAARTPLAGYGAIVAALATIGVLSFALWAHHMFTAGLSPWATTLVSAASLLIALPSGVQVFAWLATLQRGRLAATPPALFVLGFLFTFVVGGLTGVMVAVVPFDAQVHDTYFVVAHLHYVLIGGMVFPLLAAVYHWQPLLNGHALSARLGRWVFALVFGGFHLAFFPMHIAGLLGMPRRVYTYDAALGWTPWNLMASAGAAVLATGLALLAVDLVRAQRRAPREHDDPWRGATLEWLPADDYGQRSIPSVSEHEPLWSRPQLAREVDAGMHWLPGTLSGGRETLLTSPLAARLHAVIALPGDSVLPLIAAAGTAAFFLLLTVKWVWSAAACAAVATAALLAWLWQTDAPPPLARAAVGAGVSIPYGARGRTRPALWAAALFVLVDATTFASLAFAHLHVAMRAASCPPPGAALPPPGTAAGVAALWLASAATMHIVRRRFGQHRAGARTWIALFVLAFALAASAGVFDLLGHVRARLDPVADAWSATLAALLGYQVLHLAGMFLVAAYLCARVATNRLHALARTTLDVSSVLWQYACWQGVAIVLLIHALPRVLG